MALIASPATPGPWVDTSAPCNVHVAVALRAAGKAGIIRYVPLPGNGTATDISGAELAGLCDEGIEVMLVQHVRFPGWDPAAHDGGADAVTAVQWASHCGYPAGCHLWLDLEGITGSGPATACFAAAWAAHVCASGYRAGLYTGYAVPLSASELYELADINAYWSDAGPRHVATRGFAIHQGSPEVTIAGVRFDPDTLAADMLGGLPWSARRGVDG